MNNRDNLLRKAQKSKREVDWSTYKRQRNRVTSLVKKCKNQYYQKMLKENNNKPDQFWKTIKQLYPNNKSTSNQSSTFTIDGSQTTDKKIIANTFCTYFSTKAVGMKRKAFKLRDLTWSKPSNYERATRKVFAFKPVDKSFVVKNLKKLNRDKACGHGKFKVC